jgi:DNA-binding CsgD family transcriptional regulator
VAVRHISAAQRTSLSGRDLRAALDVVRRVSAVAGPDELADETMAALSELVPCDYVSYVETNPSAGRAMAMTTPRSAMVATVPEALARNLGEHPLVTYYAETGEIRALKMSDFLTHRQFVNTRLYDELFGPADTDYLLSAVLPMPPGLVVGFSLHRRARDFSERDRALLDLLEPHLVQAYERSLLRAALGSLHDAAARGEPSLVVLGRDGDVLWMSAEADAVLERHFGGSEGALPAAVRDWLGAGCRVPLIETRDGRRLRVDALGGRPAALLITERAATPDLASLRRLGLSRREAEVLSLAAVGHTNAQIAEELSVSHGTVKRHMEHVYDKLGVRTRTAAAAAAWAGDPAHP